MAGRIPTAPRFAIGPFGRLSGPRIRRAPDSRRQVEDERLGPSDPEILESYALLVALQKAGKVAIAGGKAQAVLPMECAARSNRSTGVMLPMAQQFSADPDYVVRAWQGVITYLLMDYRFGFEP